MKRIFKYKKEKRQHEINYMLSLYFYSVMMLTLSSDIPSVVNCAFILFTVASEQPTILIVVNELQSKNI